jgi:hypothetical protein
LEEAVHYADYFLGGLGASLDCLVIISSFEDSLAGDFTDGGEELLLRLMDVMESDEFGIGDDRDDVVEELLSLALLMVVSVGDHDVVGCEAVRDLCGKATWTVAFSLDIIVLDMAPVEEFDESKGDSRLSAADRSHRDENDIPSHFV